MSVEVSDADVEADKKGHNVHIALLTGKVEWCLVGLQCLCLNKFINLSHISIAIKVEITQFTVVKNGQTKSRKIVKPAIK